jgi:hypothetical protein
MQRNKRYVYVVCKVPIPNSLILAPVLYVSSSVHGLSIPYWNLGENKIMATSAECLQA